MSEFDQLTGKYAVQQACQSPETDQRARSSSPSQPQEVLIKFFVVSMLAIVLDPDLAAYNLTHTSLAWPRWKICRIPKRWGRAVPSGSLYCYWCFPTTSFYAGGKKDAYKTPCIPAYMTMKMTAAWPRAFFLSSHRELAIHQYQTGYPDARRVTICTWDVVRLIRARTAWLAANDLMSICWPWFGAAALREPILPLEHTSQPDLSSSVNAGAARIKSGSWFSVQYLRKPTFLGKDV